MTTRLGLMAIATFATACATATTPDTTEFRGGAAPDTAKQARVRRDLEACDAATGHRAFRLNVTPDGRYEFEADNRVLARPIVACMQSKGYTAHIVDKGAEGAWEIRRIGVAGE